MIKGLTQDETDALRFILGAATGGDRFARQAKRYLDGAPSAIDRMPVMKAEFDKHISVIAGATS